MEDTIQGTTSVRFAPFELDVRSRELRHGTNRVRLQDQPFEILRLMLERPGDVSPARSCSSGSGRTGPSLISNTASTPP
jgi:DNA-binding response OmpR family regulator